MIWLALIALVSFSLAAAIIVRNRHLADGVELAAVQDSPSDSIEEKVGALGAQAAHVASVGFLVLLKNLSGLLARTLSQIEKKIHQLLNRLIGRDKSGSERGSASFFLRHISERKKSLDKSDREVV